MPIQHPTIVNLKWQLAVSLPVAALLLMASVLASYSYLIGAALYIVPNLYFTLYAFRYSGARAAHWIVRSFKTGESGKLALAMLGFALVFKFIKPVHAPALFAGFSSMIVLQWLVAVKIANRFSSSPP